MKVEDFFQSKKNTDQGAQKAKKSPLESLKVDVDFYKESIREVSSDMMTEGYTLYPIFVAHQHEVALGELFLERTELGTQWSIQASSLEEFVEKGIIEKDKKDFFLKNYKDPHSHICLFVVVPEGANFVYYPYES